ncbi:hypothetical protein jhhlp_005793 [Lomentospora prolificans]|uniref:Transcription factor domain-containing protein n=1 Tax=Lomentospora prolificans TaxID=41688 RepID=A0A2N3N436_9PEZI|nr:hypothetical protein jhhlp_005793 [Lomentospora prolificans]
MGQRSSPMGDNPSPESPSNSAQQVDDFTRHLQNLTLPSPNYPPHSGLNPLSPMLSVSSASNLASPFYGSEVSDDEDFRRTRPRSNTAGLDFMELELLCHYLTHTSRIIPFDKDDLYALHVGIPNLAFRSKPLMDSILAMAAVCKCHDLEKQQPDTPERTAQIRQLLAFADEHHQSSLRQIQAEIPLSHDYDHVLANSTLMVLYGCASQCLRIRLTENESNMDNLPLEFIPTQSQWISLIRATHMAYTGLLNDQPGVVHIREVQQTGSPVNDLASVPSQLNQDDDAFIAEDGPTKETKEQFFPLLAATCGSALAKLRAKAQIMAETPSRELAGLGERQALGINNETGFQACFAALEVLNHVMGEVFSIRGSGIPTAASSDWDHPLGRLVEVSPWLRRYLSKVTMVEPTAPLRRTVTAFLNRVPVEYLTLVQMTLDLIPVHHEADQGGSWDDADPVQQLALDIYAHWLVMVMLLDGVWWMGGIGAWELRRVVTFMRNRGWLDTPVVIGESWWPGNMYNVGRELRNHANSAW